MKVATLQIRVLSDQVDKATRRLDALERQGARTQRATDGLGGNMGKMAVAATATAVAFGALAAGLAGLNKLIQVTKEFGTLSAMLKTATGSAESAKIAFQGVQAFAAQTPYDLQQATTAFIKLVNYGLTPSTEALMAYGDFASSMGKPLLQMIEAVADATTGEMERLKEFGVKAKQEGENVSFTFRGITETVGRNSAEIEAYLVKLAQNNFGGAMAEQMGKLGGVAANIEDAWNTMFLNISNMGADKIITQAFKSVLDVLNAVNDNLASGDFEASLEGWVFAAKEWAGAISALFGGFVGLVKSASSVLFAPYIAALKMAGVDTDRQFTKWGNKVSDWLEDSKRTLALLPSEVERVVKLSVVELLAMVDGGKLAARRMVAGMGIEMESLIEKSKHIARAIASNLNPAVDDYDPALGLKFADSEAARKMAASNAAFDIEGKAVNGGYDIARDQINADAASKAAIFDAIEKQAAANRAARDNAPTATGDTLAQFAIRAPTGGGAGSTGGVSGGGGAGDKNALESLRESLRTEEEVIAASYETRMQTIEAHTAAGSLEREMMTERVLTATQEEMEQLAEMRAADFEGEYNGYVLAEEALATSYANRRAIILENTQITEDQKLALLTKAESTYTEQQRKLEAARNKALLGGTTQFFNDISSIGNSFGKKGFKLAQAAAIASATISMYSAATTAYDNGVKAGGAYYGVALGAVYAAAAVAAGVANIAQIKSAQYSGEYEHGGMIGAGKYGLVGEAGPEFVQGPAIVTSARTTADAMSSKSGAANVVVNVYNLPGQEVETRSSTGANGEQELEIIVKKLETKLTGDAMNGTGTFVPAMARAFHLSRAGT